MELLGQTSSRNIDPANLVEIAPTLDKIREYLKPDELVAFDAYMAPGVTLTIEVKSETHEDYRRKRDGKRPKRDRGADGQTVESIHNFMSGSIYALFVRLSHERRERAETVVP